MKLERSKEWWMARAREEGNAVVSAGSPSQVTAGTADVRNAGVEENRIAFGKFVNLMRRRRGYSIERLAAEADLEASELLIIEDSEHIPAPRTVYKLAQTFSVSQQSLMQLAGLAVANDAGLRREAVRFAARSETVHKLTAEENAALEAFVAVLGQGVKS